MMQTGYGGLANLGMWGSCYAYFYAIWPRMKKGGIVVFDDYGFFGCEGVTQAVNDLLTEIKDAFFVHNQNGHAVLYKNE
jgi:O-methyltransferase